MLYAGTADGLYAGTLFSLTDLMFGKGGRMAPLLAAVLFAAALAVAGFAVVGGRDRTSSLIVIGSVAALTLMGQVVMSSMMHVLYPIDRSALYFLPLGLLVIALAIDHLAIPRARLAWLSLVLLVLPLRTLSTVNFTRPVMWSEQCTPRTFHTLIEERQARSDRMLLIGAHKFMGRSWSFENRRRSAPVNELDIDAFPQPLCDLLLIDTTMYDAPDGFRTIARAPGGRNNLMERMTPLRSRLVLDSTFSLPRSADEYVKLWEPQARAWHGRSVLVEVDTIASSSTRRTTTRQRARSATGNSRTPTMTWIASANSHGRCRW